MRYYNAWYRNSGRRTRYHQSADDWVQTGLAKCGASIANPSFVESGWQDPPRLLDGTLPLTAFLPRRPAKNACARCVKIWEKEQETT